MSSVFTKIIEGAIPCYKVHENDDFITFLDISPVEKGHCLVVSKKEVDYLFDHDDDLLSQAMPYCKAIAKAIEEVVPCERIGVCVLGLEVPHSHIHLVPLNKTGIIDFKKPRVTMKHDEFIELAAQIQKKVEM